MMISASHMALVDLRLLNRLVETLKTWTKGELLCHQADRAATDPEKTALEWLSFSYSACVSLTLIDFLIL